LGRKIADITNLYADLLSNLPRNRLLTALSRFHKTGECAVKAFLKASGGCQQ
jgi:hypothetical protein